MKVVYIDAQNIHKWIKNYHSRVLDWWRFFVYCKEKFQADTIKIFLWYVAKYEKLYNELKQTGYIVCFKDTLILPDWSIKGNVDIDIAIIWLQDYYENKLSRAVLVTWDGDYNSLIAFWQDKDVFECVLVPGIESSSQLLHKIAGKNVIDIAPMQKKLQKENPGIAT